LETKSLDAPDETRPFEKGRAELVTLGGVTVGRAVLEPGWRWSEHVKPIAGTSSCEVAHTGYVVSGRLRVVMDDGSEGDAGPGDAFVIPPGHDAWTVGTRLSSRWISRGAWPTTPSKPEQLVLHGDTRPS
jgi:quercetin dioxygenase-like cupin family protein